MLAPKRAIVEAVLILTLINYLSSLIVFWFVFLFFGFLVSVSTSEAFLSACSIALPGFALQSRPGPIQSSPQSIGKAGLVYTMLIPSLSCSNCHYNITVLELPFLCVAVVPVTSSQRMNTNFNACLVSVIQSTLTQPTRHTHSYRTAKPNNAPYSKVQVKVKVHRNESPPFRHIRVRLLHLLRYFLGS
jgi:hypothetical protein